MIYLYANRGCPKCNETKKFFEYKRMVFEERFPQRIENPSDHIDQDAFMQVLFGNKKLPIIVEDAMPEPIFCTALHGTEAKLLMQKLIKGKLENGCIKIKSPDGVACLNEYPDTRYGSYMIIDADLLNAKTNRAYAKLEAHIMITFFEEFPVSLKYPEKYVIDRVIINSSSDIIYDIDYIEILINVGNNHLIALNPKKPCISAQKYQIDKATVTIPTPVKIDTNSGGSVQYRVEVTMPTPIKIDTFDFFSVVVYLPIESADKFGKEDETYIKIMTIGTLYAI